MPVVEIADLFADWRMKLLFYGQSGVGKTTLAGSAALVKELCPIYWFATERGMLSIKSLLQTGRVQVMLAQGAGDLVALQNVLRNPGKFKTVVIDSLSELHALIMQVALSKTKDRTSPGRTEYREAHDRILKLLRYMDMHAKTHVIATSSDLQQVEGESGRVVSINPDMTGKLSFRTARYFDLVAYLRARHEPSLNPKKPATVVHWMQVQNYNGVSAKNRIGGAATVNEPTMEKIYSASIGPCTVLPLEVVDDPTVNVKDRKEAPAQPETQSAPQQS